MLSQFIFVNEMLDNDDPRIHELLGRNADGGEYVGVAPGLNLSEVGRPNAFASKDSSFFDVADKQTAIFMTFSELNFLLAEAADRGLISGSASDYYDAGVGASFDQWGTLVVDGLTVIQ